MPSSFRISSFVPGWLAVASITDFEDVVKVVTARSGTAAAACPACGSISQRVHSRCVRQVADLPCTGRRVCLNLITRRFFCGSAAPAIVSDGFSPNALMRQSSLRAPGGRRDWIASFITWGLRLAAGLRRASHKG